MVMLSPVPLDLDEALNNIARMPEDSYPYLIEAAEKLKETTMPVVDRT
jgi:hypothetical protein